MKFVDQTLLVEEHGRGNCMSAAVASIFGLDLDQVPDFYGKDSHEQRQKLEDWAEKKGLLVVFDYARNINGVKSWPCLKCNYIAVGKSNRGRSHAVIYNNDILIHDPHPSRTGIHEAKEIIYFVPFNIAKWAIK